MILTLLFELRPRGGRKSRGRGKGPGVECTPGGLHSQQGVQCSLKRKQRRVRCESRQGHGAGERLGLHL